ncbi:MAG: hypothetical protein NZ889_00740 [Candidatus Pacearchaeota archaeon]|nr:hypothetical protein [Candidatus Pacearchaeota archaeon]
MKSEIKLLNPKILKRILRKGIVDNRMFFVISPPPKSIFSFIKVLCLENNKEAWKKFQNYLKRYNKEICEIGYKTIAEVKNKLEMLIEELKENNRMNNKKTRRYILNKKVVNCLKKIVENLEILNVKPSEELEEKIDKIYYILWYKKYEKLLKKDKGISLKENFTEEEVIKKAATYLRNPESTLVGVEEGKKVLAYVIENGLEKQLYKKMTAVDTKLILAAIVGEIPLVTRDTLINYFQNEWNNKENKKIDVFFLKIINGKKALLLKNSEIHEIYRECFEEHLIEHDPLSL